MNKIKSFFSTPKQAIFSIACIIGACIIIGVGTAYAASSIAKSSAIGEVNAQNFAFADAGVDPASAQIVKTEFEFEDGQFVYDIEFIAENTEYEYWIKSSDGSIVKKEIDIMDQDGVNVTMTAQITLDKAKEIAMKDANVSVADVQITKEKLDVDDGVSMYDIEFLAGDAKYEYEINANTGDIYSKSKEVNAAPATDNASQETQAQATATQSEEQQTTTQSNTSQSGSISLETAKSAALKDAGVSASNATFTKAKSDYDDGLAIYDIEFYTSTHEYEYEINAKTGAVHDKSVEAFKNNSTSSGNHSSTYISVEEAKSIAASKAGLSVSEVTFKKAKLDRDDGIAIYDIEFYKDRTEYDCEINASTGAVIEFDSDYDD